MTDSASDGLVIPAERAAHDRLDSWKEIAAYLRRDVTTVQRWEKREGMPVHRHVHDKIGSVYAFKADLDAWTDRRSATAGVDADIEPQQVAPAPASPVVRSHQRTWALRLAVFAVAVAAALMLWRPRESGRAGENPLVDARFSPLTDFDGVEQAAVLSRDGKFAAFLSDRDGQMDLWITQVGMGQFYNLTRGTVPELVNPSVRTLGFSPDGSLVTFWARRGGSNPAIGVWAIPVLGGQPRPYLEDAAEFDWSNDGQRLVFHTPGPGDPLYVRDAGQPSVGKAIFSAPAGLHSHFPVWSPDQDFIYFVQGGVPDHMDIWRITPTGGTPERITWHDSLVSHPVFMNRRTLLYLASDADGSGPWIHSLDIDTRVSRRVSTGVSRYTSLAASADGRHLVATLANPKSTLWRLPVRGASAGANAIRIPLTTGNGSSPRLAAGYLLYVSSKGRGDGVWMLRGDTAVELWSAPDARIVGAPAFGGNGHQIAFSVSQDGHTRLLIANDDGTGARTVTNAPPFQGAPAWTPDGRALTVAANSNGVAHLVNVPIDGGAPVTLVNEYSVDPAWSPDGRFVAFSGPDIGTTFDVKAVTPEGRPYRLPRLTLARGSRRLVFVSPERLVVLRGELEHKNLSLIDLTSGAEQPLTHLPAGAIARDFDVSSDGRELVLERVQDESDIVLLDLPGNGPV